jgi:hypothetical protein
MKKINGWTLIGHGGDYAVWEHKEKKIFNVIKNDEPSQNPTKGMGGYGSLDYILGVKGIKYTYKKK